LDIYRKLDDPLGTAFALELLGLSELGVRNFTDAYTHLTAALDIARSLKDTTSIASVLHSLTSVALSDPHFEHQRARAWIDEGLHYARKNNSITLIQVFSVTLAELLELEGQHEQAARILEEAVQTINDVLPREQLIFIWLNLGFVYSRIGKHERSKQIFLESLAELQKFDLLVDDRAFCLLGLAGIAITEGKAQLAAKCLGALEKHKERLMYSRVDKNEYDRILSLVKAQLGDKQFSQLHKEAQMLSLKDAAQLILYQGINEEDHNSQRLSQLTKRELEILRLVAQGLSDAQVAERLVLSPRTINAHLTSIYRKLDVNSRAAATRFAMEHRLA
jgi:DNA-binding CsgD family transcriptional regulator